MSLTMRLSPSNGINQVKRMPVLFPKKNNLNPKVSSYNFNKTSKNSFSSSVVEGSFSIASNSSLRIYEAQKRKNESDSQRHTLLIKHMKSKERKINQNQIRQKHELQKEKELANKRFELRELRRKVTRITDNDSFSICDSFIRYNDIFNSKFLSYIRGRKYFIHTQDYHRNFHYHSNDLSEAHDKYNMVIDIDKLRQGAFPPTQLLKKNLSDAEIKIIRQDPSYFIKKPKYIKNVQGLQKITLLEKLAEEENSKIGISCFSNNIENEKKDIKANRARDIRFNWTLFDSKVDDALFKVMTKMNDVKNKQGLNKEIQPDLPSKLKHEVDENFRKVLNKKISSTINLDFTKRLPRKQLKSYLNQEVSDRLKHEVNFFNNRENIIQKNNNDDYLSQLQLRRIRDNLMNNKKIIISQHQQNRNVNDKRK